MGRLSDLDILQKAAAILLGPRRVNSWLELARRLHIPDDQLKRACDRVSAHFGIPLISVSDNHCLALPNPGRNFVRLLEQLYSVADQEEGLTETVTVQADPAVAAVLFPLALPSFLEIWGGSVGLRIFPIDGPVRKNIAEGTISFAFGFADDTEVLSTAEMLGPKLKWVLLVPNGHRLSDSCGPVTSDELHDNDRVFLPNLAVTNPGVNTFLKPVPAANRVECEAAHEMVVAGLGLGIAPDLLYGNRTWSGLTKRVIENAEPVQLCFFLPRRGETVLSDPQQALIAGIRRAVESCCATESVMETTDPVVNGSPSESLLNANHTLATTEGV